VRHQREVKQYEPKALHDTRDKRKKANIDLYLCIAQAEESCLAQARALDGLEKLLGNDHIRVNVLRLTNGMSCSR
jgi:hypothetical protein